MPSTATVMQRPREPRVARREQRNPSLAALLGYLDETLLRTLTTIRAITDDNELNDAEKVAGIRTLLNTHETSVSDDGVNLAALKRDLASELSENYYYRILEARSVRIQNRISPIIKAMTFQGEPGSRELLTAIGVPLSSEPKRTLSPFLNGMGQDSPSVRGTFTEISKP